MFSQFNLRTSKRPQWSRATSDPEDLKEYDAFGPWMLPIRCEQDMPRRFRSAYDLVKNADFLVKIPRGIDRREAFPGCDLYESVFACDLAGFTMMGANDDDDGFSLREVAWDEVAAVRVCNNLLKLDFVLLMREGDELAIPCRAVSSDIVTRVAAFARQQVMQPDDLFFGSVNEGEVFDDFFFNVVLADERRGGQFMMPIHFEEPGRPCRSAQNRRRITTGTMILISGGELVVVDRDSPMRRRFLAHYAYRKTYISLAKVKAFRLLPTPDGIPGHHMLLQLVLDQLRISIPCFKPPERVTELLRRRGIPQV